MTTPLVLAASLLVAAAGAFAQEPFPSRPITMVVPFPPGGFVDLTARPLAAAIEKTVRQPVSISNRPGAVGAVGTAVAANAKPDGYTVLITASTISMVPETDKLFAPSATPDAAMRALRDAARRAVEDPDFKATMAKLSTPIYYLDAPEFQKFWDRDAKRLAEVIRAIGRVEEKK